MKHSSSNSEAEAATDSLVRQGVIVTHVHRGTAWVACLLFLLGIYAIPLAQVALEHARGEDSVLPDLFKQAPTQESLRQFEESLEQTSYVKDTVQPRVQALLSAFGRVGNSKAVVGHGGWLYYVPGITYLSGPGFLDPAQLHLRHLTAKENPEAPQHPDPRTAIFAFDAMLKARGIQLILFPMPDKAMLEPLQLHGRGTLPLPVANNVDFPQFQREVQERGIGFFHPAPQKLSPADGPRYLIQDTHWAPEFMLDVAQQLAAFIRTRVDLPAPAAAPRYRHVAAEIERVGDITDMLKLPEDQTVFAPQKVTIQRVVDESGNAFTPDTASDVLLLGDSFTNVFSEEYMGWGDAAGLAPQLALALGRSVDVIAQNDSGAFATRELLFSALQSDPARLAGKRVVVWEFASRELAVGDWRPIQWDQVPKDAAP